MSPTYARVSRAALATDRYRFKTPHFITKVADRDKKGRITARGAAQRTFSAHSSVQQTYKRSPLQQEGAATASDGD